MISAVKVETAGRAEVPFAFLAEASRVLASSLDYTTTLQAVARSAVPTIADLCVVDMVSEDDPKRIERLAVAVADPAKERLARILKERYPVNTAMPRGVPTVLRTGESVLRPEVAEELLRAVAQDDEHLGLLRALGFASTMLVPLTVRGKTLGVMTFVRGSSAPQYVARDIALAEDLAGRCAIAIENARLYTAEQAARERLHALSRRLVEVQESERRHLARELHDELGQLLTAQRLQHVVQERHQQDGKEVAGVQRGGGIVFRLVHGFGLPDGRLSQPKLSLTVRKNRGDGRA